jgi:hypothetical protein
MFAEGLVSMNEVGSADDDVKDEVSVVLIEFLLVVLEMESVSEINWLVDSFD